MIDNEALRETIQSELDLMGLTGDRADQMLRELNLLSCLLIQVVKEERMNG